LVKLSRQQEETPLVDGNKKYYDVIVFRTAEKCETPAAHEFAIVEFLFFRVQNNIIYIYNTYFLKYDSLYHKCI
jgi:hypothetical protein